MADCFDTFDRWINCLLPLGLEKVPVLADNGIPYEPGYFPLGSSNNWKLMFGKVGFTDMLTEVYNNHKGAKLIGHYGFFGEKGLVVTDMDLIKDMLIRDFDHFVDRRQMKFSNSKYIANILTLLEGDKWKTTRSKISPIFTSGKLRAMVPLIDKVGDRFVDHLLTYSESNKDFEAKDMLTHFTVEVIGSCGFGIDVDCFNDPDGVFNDNVRLSVCDCLIWNLLLMKFILLQVKRITMTGKYKTGFSDALKLMFAIFVPKLAEFSSLEFLDRKSLNFFVNIIRTQIENRKNDSSIRGDFIDTLTQAMTDPNKELSLKEGEDEFDNSSSTKGDFTKEELELVVVSNAFLLFFAGFDASSSGMSLAAFFLAKNQECQEKLYQEIKDAVDANNGNEHLPYNVIQELPYLEQCIYESLRIYPIVNLERKCVSDYKFKGTDFVVPKGMMVQVPAYCIMKEDRYFPNPEEFNPDNFSEEALARRGPYPFMGFGHGPRNCVGKRFALLQVKIAIARLIYSYRLVPCDKTVEKLETDPTSISMQPKGGLWVKPIKRTNY